MNSGEALIYHIAHAEVWMKAVQAGMYEGDTLATEGFIHCSTAQQVLATAERIFRGQRDLVLLEIESARVQAEIRYEALYGPEAFPHIYGALNIDAVRQVAALNEDEQGHFAWPFGAQA